MGGVSRPPIAAGPCRDCWFTQAGHSLPRCVPRPGLGSGAVSRQTERRCPRGVRRSRAWTAQVERVQSREAWARCRVVFWFVPHTREGTTPSPATRHRSSRDRVLLRSAVQILMHGFGTPTPVNRPPRPRVDVAWKPAVDRRPPNRRTEESRGPCHMPDAPIRGTPSTPGRPGGARPEGPLEPDLPAWAGKTRTEALQGGGSGGRAPIPARG